MSEKGYLHCSTDWIPAEVEKTSIFLLVNLLKTPWIAKELLHLKLFILIGSE